MKLNERLANRLTGGAYKRAQQDFRDADITLGRHAAEIDRLLTVSAFAEAQAREATARAYQLQHDLNLAQTALTKIADEAERQLNPNATVRRMGREAAAALGREAAV